MQISNSNNLHQPMATAQTIIPHPTCLYRVLSLRRPTPITRVMYLQQWALPKHRLTFSTKHLQEAAVLALVAILMHPVRTLCLGAIQRVSLWEVRLNRATLRMWWQTTLTMTGMRSHRPSHQIKSTRENKMAWASSIEHH